jgi:hypothetical protein
MRNFLLAIPLVIFGFFMLCIMIVISFMIQLLLLPSMAVAQLEQYDLDKKNKGLKK